MQLKIGNEKSSLNIKGVLTVWKHWKKVLTPLFSGTGIQVFADVKISYLVAMAISTLLLWGTSYHIGLVTRERAVVAGHSSAIIGKNVFGGFYVLLQNLSTNSEQVFVLGLKIIMPFFSHSPS